MKKAISTIGLFALVMVLTSFTTPETIIDNITYSSIDGNGGQDTGHTRKRDFTGLTSSNALTNQIVDIDGNGGQDAGRNKKKD
jgi:hypothetical protein